jgi:hypothetical protein
MDFKLHVAGARVKSVTEGMVSATRASHPTAWRA